MDMHSGGSMKEPYRLIFIDLPLEEAIKFFTKHFGHHPEHVTCTCCGEDYSIDEDETFAESSAYDRKCRWDDDKDKHDLTTYRYSVTEFMAQEDVLVIFVIDGDCLISAMHPFM